MAAAAAVALNPASAGGPRRLLVIFNPTSGRATRAEGRLRRVVAELERLGCSVVVRATRSPGDAECLARQAEAEFDVIVAAGGDGTVNEVVNGLAGAPRPVAVIPLGTANVLANEIAMPRRPRALAMTIAGGRARPVWPGRAGDRLFMMMLGVGFDVAVLRRLDLDAKRRLGKFAFIGPILGALWREPAQQFLLRADGADHEAASAIVTRGRLYAGRFVLAPAARLDAPVLHILMLRCGGRLSIVRAMAALALGRLDRLPEATVLRSREVSLAAAGPADFQLDGEIRGELPIAVELAASPLLLVQPG